MRCVVVSMIIVVGCGSSSKEPDKVVIVGSGSSTADARLPSPGSGTALPAGLELEPGEKLHDPVVETAWNVPGGTVTATVVDYTPTAPGGQPITKLVVWGNGKRHDIVKTVSICDAQAELRHVTDRIVFHCAIRPVGDEPEARIEDWLVRWSERKNSPLRNRHWRGDPADSEPRWANPTSTSSDHHKRKSGDRCCCEATLDDITTHAWEQPSDCTADPENEVSAACVDKAKCRGIKIE